MDALSIPKAIVGGYDWGGRACCIVSALYPERIMGLVSMAGYNIQNIAKYSEPDIPEIEMLNWYQYYFHSERGRLWFDKIPERTLPTTVEQLVSDLEVQ